MCCMLKMLIEADGVGGSKNQRGAVVKRLVTSFRGHPMIIKRSVTPKGATLQKSVTEWPFF